MSAAIWDGIERRRPEGVCPECGRCDTIRSIERLLGKLATAEEMKTEIGKVYTHSDRKVPIWVLQILIPVAVTVIGVGFGWFGYELRATNTSITMQTEAIHGIQQAQGLLLYQVQELKSKVEQNGKH